MTLAAAIRRPKPAASAGKGSRNPVTEEARMKRGPMQIGGLR